MAVKNMEMYLQAVGTYIDTILISTTDFGTQTGELFNPDTFEALYMPNYKKMCASVHKNSKAKTLFHSCGSIRNIIPYFIEAGCDILNPIQANSYGMNPKELKAEFGSQLVFWGAGVDSQTIYPTGSVEEVREQVKERQYMITTVTLNPCIDRSIFVSNFRPGELNRVVDSRSDVSGKAINVGIAVKKIGKNVECLGFNYRMNGKELENALREYEIAYEFVWVDGRLRTNTKILDMDTHILTELNEWGTKVSEEDIEAMKSVILERTSGSSTVVIGGSVPPGVNNFIYRDIISDLSNYPVKVILDAEKELLLEGIKARPYLIKPNLYELEVTFGRKCSTIKEVANLARSIVGLGVEVVCVSLGKDGALICDKEEAYYSKGLKLNIRGVQGAGDSMVAGICIAIEEGLPVKEMLRYGMAASAGSLVLEGTQMCGRESFYEFKEKIVLEKLEVS